MKTNALRLCLLLAVLASGLNAQVIINEYCNDPYATAAGGLDTNLDGVAATGASQSDDEFVEIVNFGATTVNVGGWTISDAFGLRHTFPGSTMLPPGAAIVVFGGGSVVAFNSMGLSGVTANTGSLGLNNSGDSIILADSAATVIDMHSWVSGGPTDGDGESITRVPEGPGGAFTMHTIATGIAHSAGFMNDGLTAYGAASFPSTTYPGTGEDLALETGINASTTGGSGNDVKTAVGGDLLTIRVESPGSTFNGQPLLLVGEVFITGFPPSPFLPGTHVSAAYTPIINAFAPSPFGVPTLSFLGSTSTFALPSGLSGQSIMLQAGVLSGLALNGNYATSDAHEIQML